MLQIMKLKKKIVENSFRRYQELKEEEEQAQREEYLDPKLFAQKLTRLVLEENNFYDAYEKVWTELIIQNHLVRHAEDLNKS